MSVFWSTQIIALISLSYIDQTIPNYRTVQDIDYIFPPEVDVFFSRRK